MEDKFPVLSVDKVVGSSPPGGMVRSRAVGSGVLWMTRELSHLVDPRQDVSLVPALLLL